MATTIYEADTISVRVTVNSLNTDGTIAGPYDLTGATLSVYFGVLGANSRTVGTTAVIDAVNGIVDCIFPSGTATAGTASLQLEVTKNNVKTTAIDENFIVKKSLSRQ